MQAVLKPHSKAREGAAELRNRAAAAAAAERCSVRGSGELCLAEEAHTRTERSVGRALAQVAMED